MSDYEKYLLIADKTYRLSGGYQGFVNFREVMGVINTMCSKDKLVDSKELWVELGFNKIKVIANQLMFQKI